MDMQSVRGHAISGARKHNTRNHACFSARNVASNASVFLQGLMLTKKFVLATITGRPREEDPNALKI